MTILLKRNHQKDANFSISNYGIKEGDIVELIIVNKRKYHRSIPPDVKIKHSDGVHYNVNLNCYDYVKQL